MSINFVREKITINQGRDSLIFLTWATEIRCKKMKKIDRRNMYYEDVI